MDATDPKHAARAGPIRLTERIKWSAVPGVPSGLRVRRKPRPDLWRDSRGLREQPPPPDL